MCISYRSGPRNIHASNLRPSHIHSLTQQTTSLESTWQGWHKLEGAQVPESPIGASNQRIPFRMLHKQEINCCVWVTLHSLLKFVCYCNESTWINMHFLSQMPTAEAVCFPTLFFTRAFHQAIVLLKTLQMVEENLALIVIKLHWKTGFCVVVQRKQGKV